MVHEDEFKIGTSKK